MLGGPVVAPAVLLAALAVLTASHLAWAAADGRPPPWDQAIHLEAALRCARMLRDGEWLRMLSLSAFYPPLGHCAAGLLHRVVGPSPFAALAVTQTALAVAVLVTYAIGVRLGSAAAGFAAAGLLAGYSEVVLESRVFRASPSPTGASSSRRAERTRHVQQGPLGALQAPRMKSIGQ